MQLDDAHPGDEHTDDVPQDDVPQDDMRTDDVPVDDPTPNDGDDQTLHAPDHGGTGGRELPRTGDEAVDAALDELRALDPSAPPAEQLPVLAAVHETLQRRLSAAAE